MRILISILLLFITSCKKKDNPEPVITITSPISGEVFMPGDTIHIEADISDNNVLSSVTLKLLNAGYSPEDHQESFSINASSYHLSYDYVIENKYLTSGTYYLTLSVNDGDNNKNEYRPIVIHEIPRSRKTIYVFIQSDSNNVKVNTVDSSNQLNHQFDVAGDYSGSEINSRYNVLSMSGKYSGAINQFSLLNNANTFTFPAYNNTLPSYQYLTSAHEYTFVSFYDGRIRAYDFTGHIQFNSQQPVSYQPGTICINDKYVFAEGFYQSAGENRLVVIFYPTGVARQEINAGFDIVSIISRSDNDIILFGNKNGDGKIYLYNVTSNGMNDFHSIFGKTIFSAIAIDSDRYAIATSGGLYSYEVSSNNLIPVDVSDAIYSLAYDDINGILFVNAGRAVRQYNFPNSGILNTVMSSDSVLDVKVLYSK